MIFPLLRELLTRNVSTYRLGRAARCRDYPGLERCPVPVQRISSLIPLISTGSTTSEGQLPTIQFRDSNRRLKYMHALPRALA
jgi:hypothetical protein